MIQSTTKRLFRKLIGNYFIPKIQFSYSQFGEDLIIANLFYQLGISCPSYLDVGANEPKYISNTYYFYEQGSRGLLIEPNPYLFLKLKNERPYDRVVNIGIGCEERENANFYVFPDYANGLSTFSEMEALHWQEIGMKGIGKIRIEKIIKMKIYSINTILNTYFKDEAPNLLSIDVEGLDFEILKCMDFIKYRPQVVCVETMKYDENNNTYKDTSIIDLMLSNQYMVYADTRVNTIFCKNELNLK